jgi:hypothetical protein
MAQEMVVNKDNKKALIKAKMEINIEKKKYFKLINLKITKNFGVLIIANFKRDVLNLYLEVHIPNVVSWVIYLIANDFICKV